jgi:hypothetical protein
MSSRIIAEQLAQRGFSVFPLKAGAKFPPLWKEWPAKASTEIPADWPTIANVGVHCAGLVVIDVDPRNGGFESLMALELDSPLPATLESITPSGGRHIFYRLPAGHPGVPNRAHALGRGVDVKSTNGYVVGAGSRTAAGEYRFIDPAAEIADAPTWIVEQLGAAVLSERSKIQDVPDAPDEVVERAAEWLKTAERSVKGAGGDDTAYRVACELRDRGLSYLQTCDLMRSDAWDYGCGWRNDWLEEKPIASAYRYAKNEPGVKKPVTSDDFPVLEQQPAEPAKKPAKAVSFAEMTSRAVNGNGYIIKGLLQRGEYAGLYGAPGQGKTFVALDLAYHVAAGAPWMGRKVHQGAVLYVGFEAFGGLASRALALRQHYSDETVPLYFAPGGFNLRELAGRQALGAIIAELPEVPSLIIFDTFAYALAGGDENAAKDVSSFNEGVQALIAHTGANVMVIHHTGKDAARGSRGSSALPAALDTELEIADSELRPCKQRNMEIGEPIGFRLQQIQIGMDEDNELVSSCVVMPAEIVEDKGRIPRPGTNERRVWDVLCENRPNNNPISGDDLRSLCTPFLPSGDSPSRKSFYDTLQKLRDRGLIDTTDGSITRKLE